MIQSSINVYLYPSGIRSVQGYINAVVQPSVGVAKLLCISGRACWFAFAQPTGAKLTDGHKTMEAAFEEGKEVLLSVARVRHDTIITKRYVTGPARWRRG